MLGNLELDIEPMWRKVCALGYHKNVLSQQKYDEMVVLLGQHGEGADKRALTTQGYLLRPDKPGILFKGSLTAKSGEEAAVRRVCHQDEMVNAVRHYHEVNHAGQRATYQSVCKAYADIPRVLVEGLVKRCRCVKNPGTKAKSIAKPSATKHASVSVITTTAAAAAAAAKCGQGQRQQEGKEKEKGENQEGEEAAAPTHQAKRKATIGDRKSTVATTYEGVDTIPFGSRVSSSATNMMEISQPFVSKKVSELPAATGNQRNHARASGSGIRSKVCNRKPIAGTLPISLPFGGGSRHKGTVDAFVTQSPAAARTASGPRGSATMTRWRTA